MDKWPNFVEEALRSGGKCGAVIKCGLTRNALISCKLAYPTGVRHRVYWTEAGIDAKATLDEGR